MWVWVDAIMVMWAPPTHWEEGGIILVRKQAETELGQVQVKLDVIVQVEVKVEVEIVVEIWVQQLAWVVGGLKRN